ncbi:MAG TPA: hypothetical protein DC058_21540 [Planctomycetaceae bacterium]|jgi:hypothetical protein|nr:hypothetical protein [Planctomycetaceae bacterium]HBC63783.1 hypothetical protein [Planctomycetaceae bacterium]
MSLEVFEGERLAGDSEWCQDDIAEAATFVELQAVHWRQWGIRGDDLKFSGLQGANIGQAFKWV